MFQSWVSWVRGRAADWVVAWRRCSGRESGKRREDSNVKELVRDARRRTTVMVCCAAVTQFIHLSFWTAQFSTMHWQWSHFVQFKLQSPVGNLYVIISQVVTVTRTRRHSEPPVGSCWLGEYVLPRLPTRSVASYYQGIWTSRQDGGTSGQTSHLMIVEPYIYIACLSGIVLWVYYSEFG